MRGRLARLATLACLAAGCQRGSSDSDRTAPASGDAVGSSAAPSSVRARTVFEIAAGLDTCSLGHAGVMLDFGDLSLTPSLHSGAFRSGSDEIVEHGGASWLRARTRTVSASFVWPDDMSEGGGSAFIEARVRGLSARTIAVSIDGKPFGAFPLVKDETRIGVARASGYGGLAPGGHELGLRFVGGSRSDGEAFADVDWVHVGAGEPDELYAAPSRSEVLVDAKAGAKAMRAISLRAPGFVRCTRWIPADATVETALATAGGGDADVEARIVRDRQPPVVLGAAHVPGGQDWAPWSLPVTGLDGDGALASLELVVRRAAKGTHALFGTPRIVATRAPSAVAFPPARSVVLVVLGSTAAKALGPWGGPHPASELAGLASAGATFLRNRAPTSLASAAVAAMLTGLPPWSSGVSDVGRIGDALTTVQQACREGGVTTAMFTADPTTGAAFGFARGWDEFVVHDPLENAPGTRVFDDAAAWIEGHRDRRFFVAVHARGGHPPWDVTPDELKTMLPAGYLGMIDPRRAAEALAKIRRHPSRLKDDDRTRAMALYEHAIDESDSALGHLLSALKGVQRDADTAVVVTSDVAESEAAPVPFDDPEVLEEPMLSTPLVIRWPSASLAGTRVVAATTATDLARTILGALGMQPPATFRGLDLRVLAEGAALSPERPLLATRGSRFSLRWGPLVLFGTRDREARMCDLSIDPACIADARASAPLSLEAMRREVVAALGPASAVMAPPSPVLDEHTSAALARWGRGTAREE